MAKLDPVDWLTGQFSLTGCRFEIPGHDDGYLSFPEVCPQDPDPTGTPGSYELAWSDLLRGPVTITVGNYQFTGKVTDGYNKGYARTNLDGQGGGNGVWENAYWFTFSGDWSNGWHTLGEVQCVVHGDTDAGDFNVGTLTIATRTRLFRKVPRRPAKGIRKPELVSG